VRAVAAAIVGEQGAHSEAVSGEELARIAEEADGGFRFLIRQQLDKSHAGVVIDGHMEGQQAGMRAPAAQPSIAAHRDLAEAGHALDVEVNKVSRSGMLIAHDGRARMQVAPSTKAGAAQHAADSGGGKTAAQSDLITGHGLATQRQNLF